ncbi:MAG TPA: fused MFS/spermidine synthase [Candidatus Saccharimonadales bacterium]|nr:fused MFS/spermidine synthase [Candidatus Saccharimonadales bacterium]
MKKQTVLAPEPVLSPWQRRYLYFTAAITGAAIMVVEILGAKMLAPYVGTSHFVWTAQIAVTMVALASGYYVGGRWADKSLKLDRLYWSIVAAAAYLCVAILIIEPVAYAFLGLRLAIGTLFTSAFLFLLPLALLAMTGPFFIRVLTSNVSGVGGNVGRLSAVSTLGSVLGTILIGYILIPFLHNSWIMFSTAALLLAVAAVYKMAWSRKGLPVALLVTVGILGFGYFAAAQSLKPGYRNLKELTRRNSNFGMLQVMQQEGSNRRFYFNDYLTQNTYDTDTKQSTSMFTYMLHELARAYTTNVQHVLCIGLGVGIVPMEFAREGTRVDVIEINPAVVPVARDFFGLEPDKLNINFGDGRYFVNKSTNHYDAVVLDAFLGDSCPSHLMTREAFMGINRILKPEGTLVVNTFCDFEAGHDFFGASLYKTMRSVFPQVLIHQLAHGGNALFVASHREKLQMVRTNNFDYVHPHCRSEVEMAFESLREPNPSHGQILTDDYNPVEYYDAVNRENLRRYLASAMVRQ